MNRTILIGSLLLCGALEALVVAGIYATTDTISGGGDVFHNQLVLALGLVLVFRRSARAPG
jgi:hypothetical protein